MLHRMARWFFQNRETGAITIGQFPNTALWLFILASAGRWLLSPSGRTGSLLEILAQGGLYVWAIDEVLRGVNPWRRCLGGAALCWSLAAFFHDPRQV